MTKIDDGIPAASQMNSIYENAVACIKSMQQMMASTSALVQDFQTRLSYGALALGLLLALIVIIGWRVKRRDGSGFAGFRQGWFRAAFIVALIGIVMLALLTFVPIPPQFSSVIDLLNIGALATLAASAVLFACWLAVAVGGLLGGFGSGTRRGHPIVIAIDGPAASGKGTLARRIAEHYRMPCLDTGLLYRAVARDVVAKGAGLDDQIAAVTAALTLDPKSLDDPLLRTEAASEAASVVAKFPDVRSALLEYQRTFANNKRGAVLDGRDIGTIVCPDADVKIYVTAKPEERARRRHLELQARGDTSRTFDDVLEDIRRRDSRDIGRPIAPLWPAADAIQLDTTTLNPDEAFQAAVKIVDERVRG